MGAVLERKVWVETFDKMYPNLYVFLVGPPGVGKTVMTNLVRGMWLTLPDLHVAPSSLTKASLADAVAGAERRVNGEGEPLEFNSLQIASNELGTFLPQWDDEFMSFITDLWDGHFYGEARRGIKKQMDVKHPQLNLLAATTPSFLNSKLPEGAWDQGFLARCLCIYSGDKVRKSLFNSKRPSETQRRRLLKNLERMFDMKGGFTLQPEAADIIDSVYLETEKTAPQHPKLQYYSQRRHAQLIKLSMIVSAMDDSLMEITLDHVVEAFDLMTEAEAAMGDIFRAFDSSGDVKIIEDLWYYVFQKCQKVEFITENRVMNFVASRTPSHNVERLISLAVKMKVLVSWTEPKIGTVYKAGRRRDEEG